MNFINSKAALCLFSLAALSSGSLWADTFTVKINSGTLCQNTATYGGVAYCSANQITNGASTSASISLQPINGGATSEANSLNWTVSGNATYGFTYILNISTLKAGLYNVATPTGVYKVATANGVLTYQESFSTNLSGGGTITVQPAVSSATFVSSDYSTEGNWPTKYGANGYFLPQIGAALPSWVSLTMQGQNLETYQDPSFDTRAPLIARNSTQRIAAAWYAPAGQGGQNPSYFAFGMNLTDGKPHSVSLYLLDFNSAGLNEGVVISDAATGVVLDQAWVNSFTFGRYLTWSLQGNVVIKIVNNGGPKSVVSGLFFN